MTIQPVISPHILDTALALIHENTLVLPKSISEFKLICTVLILTLLPFSVAYSLVFYNGEKLTQILIFFALMSILAFLVTLPFDCYYNELLNQKHQQVSYLVQELNHGIGKAAGLIFTVGPSSSWIAAQFVDRAEILGGGGPSRENGDDYLLMDGGEP